MEPHDEIIAAMLEVLTPEGGEIRLLGRLCTPVLGNTSMTDVFLFIPDLHLLSPARQAHYGQYGFNHAETQLLARLLQRLAQVRNVWQATGEHTLITIQVGDFFDVWREFVGPIESIADETHKELRDVLYRGQDRALDCLNATMILGNHDTKDGKALEEIPFRLTAFNRSPDGRPFLFTTHGDVFDILELSTAEPLREFVVNFIGEGTPVSTYEVQTWGAKAGQINKPLTVLEEAIVSPQHTLQIETGAVKVEPQGQLPQTVARIIQSAAEAQHGHFEKYYQALQLPAAQNTLAESVQVVVIGHTHQATLILCQPPDSRLLIMMDVGAWIEQCSYRLDDGTVVTEPSAQIGVIHVNDIRLYQIRTDVAS